MRGNGSVTADPLPAAPGQNATTSERAVKNQDLFDDASGEAWRLLVYEPVHQGWKFTNIGGRHVLDEIGQRARLGPSSQVLELCCGLGDTCCYLGSRFGCSVDGLEINREQLTAARSNLQEAHPDLVHRVRFFAGDVLTWQPDRAYDVVYVMDSLMYLPGRHEILRKARLALAPGGCLVLAEVLAGSGLEAADRAYMWDTEGVAELPSPEEQEAMLAQGGFEAVSVDLRSDLAVTCFEKICRANHQHRDALLAMGAERHADVESNDFYRRAFRDGHLVYGQAFARRPERDPASL